MGKPEQFAKDTFAEEVDLLTGGALAWKDPPETRLSDVQADGMLMVRDAARAGGLHPPWREARGHDEILLEIKMAGGHTDPLEVERLLLRRQARQVERMEQAPEDAPWSGHEPAWMSASIAPDSLRARYAVRRFARGCYRVGPSAFAFVWIAANELPLRDDLIPFLLARSGKALDEFGIWAAKRMPPSWVFDMLGCVAMSERAREHAFTLVEDNTPEQLARDRHLGQLILARRPELAEPFQQEARQEGRLAEARSALRRVLARRGLVVRPEDDARVDACTDVATLERWHDDAIVATTAAKVFGPPGKKRRAAAQRRT